MILRHDLPDLAGVILAHAEDHPSLREALCDYELARASEDDETLNAEIRAEWAEIRKELVGELERHARRLTGHQNQQRTLE
ncbi:hypothetical protein CLV78_1011007 [Aliiruegeria haliotis]|uniref:Uncharacterized protein n=1 Tax=Aliiruegeria haliotis TaxID=1280846 RepID=A0A2T0S0K8_9RHOB|nr:hypothetical protein [Aliiruegeria haliotis]PRY26902.1 hypothetical protein CLV78_1011007 [Aliiruegeria haliotis]